MANVPPPDDIPPVFRGGPSLVFQPHEVKIDKGTGLLKTTYGVSVDADATRVVHFGGAYHVVALPDELTIIQRGRRAQHYEIVPAVPITPERYQELLNQVELELVLAE
jgi:hypothetical protein